MKVIMVAVFAVLMAGCAAKQTVTLGGKPVNVKAITDKHSIDVRKKVAKRTDGFLYHVKYADLFLNGGDVDLGSKYKSGGLNADHAMAAGWGAAGVLGAATGSVFAPLAGLNFVMGISNANEEDVAVKMAISRQYKELMAGGVFLLHPSKDKGTKQAIDDMSPDFREIMKTDCPSIKSNMRVYDTKDWGIQIASYCPQGREFLYGINYDGARFPEFAGVGGSVIEYVAESKKRNPAELKALADKYRQMLPGWFVIQAIEAKNPLTGNTEKLVSVSYNGVEKLFPLPPPPTFK